MSNLDVASLFKQEPNTKKCVSLLKKLLNYLEKREKKSKNKNWDFTTSNLLGNKKISGMYRAYPNELFGHPIYGSLDVLTKAGLIKIKHHQRENTGSHNNTYTLAEPPDTIRFRLEYHIGIYNLPRDDGISLLEAFDTAREKGVPEEILASAEAKVKALGQKISALEL